MPPTDSPLAGEKIAQAIGLLERFNLDLWLTFVHETSLVRDPALDLICPFDLTWHSALMVHRSGESVAIVGRYDAANLERLQAYTRVLSYDQSVRPAMVGQLRAWRPATVALNFSRSDPASSGLTYGLKLVLDEILKEAGVLPNQVVSAEAFLGSLRGRKTPREVERLRAAVTSTEALIDELTPHVRIGRSERQLADVLHAWMRDLGLQPSWDWETDPAVNTGPESEMGHAGPSDLVIAPGHLVHIDFGVRRDGFCADLQRMWYVLRPGETEPPQACEKHLAGCPPRLAGRRRGAAPGKPRLGGRSGRPLHDRRRGPARVQTCLRPSPGAGYTRWSHGPRPALGTLWNHPGRDRRGGKCLRH